MPRSCLATGSSALALALWPRGVACSATGWASYKVILRVSRLPGPVVVDGQAKVDHQRDVVLLAARGADGQPEASDSGKA